MAALFILTSFCSVLFITYKLCSNRISSQKIPKAHWSVGLFPGWILVARYFGCENAEIQSAHDRLGPIIRLAPKEISINFVDGGLKTVYGNFEKHSWYHSFENFDHPNMFSTIDFGTHSEKRRALSRTYSKSRLLHSESLRMQNEAILGGRLKPILAAHANNKEALEIFNTMLSVSMDLITAFSFGMSSSSNFLQDTKQRELRLKQYQSRAPYMFYAQEMQSFWKLLKNLGLSLIPRSVHLDKHNFEVWIGSMCDGGLRSVKERASAGEEGVDDDTAIQAFCKANQREDLQSGQLQDGRLTIASEMADHVIAGHETSAIAETYLIYELCRNRALQGTLQSEIRPLFKNCNEHRMLPDFVQVDQLPFLHACLYEVLRLHSPVVGPQARTTPKNGAKLGDIIVKGGVRVSARASTLHHNSEIYPEPQLFKPERWLNADGSVKKVGEATEMHNWWWAFGSGGRTCLGTHFAMHSIKMVISLLYSNYTTELVSCGDMAQMDSYIGPPKGGRLIVRLKKIE